MLSNLILNDEIERAIDAVPIETNALGYDPWGFHPEKAKLYFSLAYQIYRYFRPKIYGIEKMPSGRVLVVPNHSGQLPFDGLVISVAALLHGKPPRVLRAMVERWFPTLPFVNEAFSRSGTVLGDPINCRNLLEADNAILVFPEGARGSGKTWDHRYRLVPFGRGFMRLALQTNTPILPVAVIGGEESIISVYNIDSLAKLLNTPYAPVPPHLPLVGLAAFLPLPVRFHLHFGEPMHFEGPFDDEDEVIEQKVRQVMDRIQQMIDKGLAMRESVFG
jgi:1-acyl-sn-glycerol-3-phosphate acyltransferase